MQSLTRRTFIGSDVNRYGKPVFVSLWRVLAATTWFAVPALTHAQVDVQEFAQEGVNCDRLLTADFSTTEDAPAQIVSAHPMKATGAIPAYCKVEGYVWRNVKFRTQFPLVAWNGKNH